MKSKTKGLFTALRARNWGRLVGPTVSACVLAVLLATGVGASTTPTTFYACVNMKTGAIYMVNAGDTCKSGYSLISWNQVGPQGPQGPQGPAGPQGPQGPAGPTQTLKVQLVTSPYIFIPSGDAGQANVLCPAGTFVTGGGYESLPAGGVVTSSHPEGNGWFVQAVDTNPAASGPITLRAFALCASLA